MRHLFLVLALTTLAGCNNNQNNQPTSSDPLVRGLETQMHAQESDSISHRIQVRQVAIDHIKNHYPQSSIQGVSIFSNGGNDYTVGVDVTSGDGRQTIYTSVELFVKDSGENYWKTRFVPPLAGAKPFEFSTKSYESPKK